MLCAHVLQAKEREHLECFVTELVNKTQSLLYVLDDCITVDDVISGGEVKIPIDQYVDIIDCIIDHYMMLYI